MADSTGPGREPEDLGPLKRRHAARWDITYREFADGWLYDARPLDERRPRIVVSSAGAVDEAIGAVEDGTWQP